MGLILDSSVVIAAERRGETVEQLIARIIQTTGDQEAALSAIGLTELIHGIYRAQTEEIRQRRELFINELLADLKVYPYTKGNGAAGRQDRWRAIMAIRLVDLADRTDSCVRGQSRPQDLSNGINLAFCVADKQRAVAVRGGNRTTVRRAPPTVAVEACYVRSATDAQALS